MVVLADPDPDWAERAEREAARWRAALGAHMQAIHHIGSTAVPGLVAKPIIDLLPVVAEVALDTIQADVRAMGYDWMGPYGLPTRRYCRLDAADGTRLVHAHVYAKGDPAIAKALAFRDALRTDPALRADYAAIKQRCAVDCQDTGRSYPDCKAPFITRAVAEALKKAAR